MIKQVIATTIATAVLLSPIVINARSIDDYGRNLQSHENLGGHTKARHVSKSYTWLRNRCKSQRYLATASSFTSLRNAESILADMVKDNRSLIQNYASGRSSTNEMNEKERWWERPWGYGRAINCKLVGKKRTFYIRNPRKPWKKIPITVELDKMSYMPTAKGVLRRKSTAAGNWYLLTSYPSLF